MSRSAHSKSRIRSKSKTPETGRINSNISNSHSSETSRSGLDGIRRNNRGRHRDSGPTTTSNSELDTNSDNSEAGDSDGTIGSNFKNHIYCIGAVLCVLALIGVFIYCSFFKTPPPAYDDPNLNKGENGTTTTANPQDSDSTQPGSSKPNGKGAGPKIKKFKVFEKSIDATASLLARLFTLDVTKEKPREFKGLWLATKPTRLRFHNTASGREPENIIHILSRKSDPGEFFCGYYKKNMKFIDPSSEEEEEANESDNDESSDIIVHGTRDFVGSSCYLSYSQGGKVILAPNDDWLKEATTEDYFREKYSTKNVFNDPDNMILENEDTDIDASYIARPAEPYFSPLYWQVGLYPNQNDTVFMQSIRIGNYFSFDPERGVGVRPARESDSNSILTNLEGPQWPRALRLRMRWRWSMRRRFPLVGFVLEGQESDQSTNGKEESLKGLVLSRKTHTLELESLNLKKDLTQQLAWFRVIDPYDEDVATSRCLSDGLKAGPEGKTKKLNDGHTLSSEDSKVVQNAFFTNTRHIGTRTFGWNTVITNRNDNDKQESENPVNDPAKPMMIELINNLNKAFGLYQGVGLTNYSMDGISVEIVNTVNVTKSTTNSNTKYQILSDQIESMDSSIEGLEAQKLTANLLGVRNGQESKTNSHKFNSTWNMHLIFSHDEEDELWRARLMFRNSLSQFLTVDGSFATADEELQRVLKKYQTNFGKRDAVGIAPERNEIYQTTKVKKTSDSTKFVPHQLRVALGTNFAKRPHEFVFEPELEIDCGKINSGSENENDKNPLNTKEISSLRVRLRSASTGNYVTIKDNTFVVGDGEKTDKSAVWDIILKRGFEITALKSSDGGSNTVTGPGGNTSTPINQLPLSQILRTYIQTLHSQHCSESKSAILYRPILVPHPSIEDFDQALIQRRKQIDETREINPKEKVNVCSYRVGSGPGAAVESKAWGVGLDFLEQVMDEGFVRIAAEVSGPGFEPEAESNSSSNSTKGGLAFKKFYMNREGKFQAAADSLPSVNADIIPSSANVFQMFIAHERLDGGTGVFSYLNPPRRNRLSRSQVGQMVVDSGPKSDSTNSVAASSSTSKIRATLKPRSSSGTKSKKTHEYSISLSFSKKSYIFELRNPNSRLAHERIYPINTICSPEKSSYAVGLFYHWPAGLCNRKAWDLPGSDTSDNHKSIKELVFRVKILQKKIISVEFDHFRVSQMWAIRVFGEHVELPIPDISSSTSKSKRLRTSSESSESSGTAASLSALGFPFPSVTVGKVVMKTSAQVRETDTLMGDYPNITTIRLSNSQTLSSEPLKWRWRVELVDREREAVVGKLFWKKFEGEILKEIEKLANESG